MHHRLSILLCFFSLSQMLMANPNPSNYWQCASTDAENKQWIAQGNYELTALNNAFDACKKQSVIPASCTASRGTCEQFANGLSTRAMWTCTAFDPTANKWVSNPYPHREDAALAAKAYCQEQSDYYEACYTNLITCTNKYTRE